MSSEAGLENAYSHPLWVVLRFWPAK